MSDVIKLLPDSVANQIAAGEVIQRPSSVIKELVENAIDAGATEVQIVLREAGRTLIQVIDNGVGMSAPDARLAFERHSTSKIRQAEDLFNLRTMGFRGEALASIAAIAQVELRTCLRGEQIGTRVEISASTCQSQEPDVCPEGSNFMIKNLFFNVPARRKFLKSNQVELSNIIKEFEKLALVNHTVAFTVTHNDTLLYKLPGGTFKERIRDLHGTAISDHILPVKLDTSLVKIDGFVGRPENARKRGAMQFFFVNGRYMRHPYFHKAVMMSYSQLIPDDSQPNYYLNFTVDPTSIDVNIHPTKSEIKFECEQMIWQILSAGVKEALGRFSAVPSIDFDVTDAPQMPAYEGSGAQVKMPDLGVDGTFNPFKQPASSGGSHRGAGSTYRPQQVPADWTELYKGFEGKATEQQPLSQENAEPLQQPIPLDSADQTEQEINYGCIQLKGKYLLSASKGGILVVDQHRAHVLVLFNRYLDQMSGEAYNSQKVLFPEILSLSASQDVIMQTLEPELAKLGFQMSRLSGNEWSVGAIPAGLGNGSVKDVLMQMLESVETGGKRPAEKLSEDLALQLARAAAIPYGRSLNKEEMDTLLGELLSLPEPNYTPDGKLVITILPVEQIEKLF